MIHEEHEETRRFSPFVKVGDLCGHRISMKIAVLAISLVLMYSPNLYADIAFVANFDGNWDLFTVSDNGSNPVQLTHTAYDEKDPCWSADRKTIVYAPSDGHLRLIDIDTAQSMIIAETEQKNHKISPFFSPDGNEIVFAQFRPPSEGDDTDLMIYNIQTGATRRFLDQYALQMWPSWSPDGAKIVYANMHCSDDCGKDCSGALGCRCQRKVGQAIAHDPRILSATGLVTGC